MVSRVLRIWLLSSGSSVSIRSFCSSFPSDVHLSSEAADASAVASDAAASAADDDVGSSVVLQHQPTAIP